jgi:imidazolonepropionase-like amidohydrolase
MPTVTPTFTILKPARLMDGTDSPPKTGMAVLLQDDRIQAIGPEDKIAFPGAATGEVLAYPDATLLPGLIDCHTHTNMPGTGRRGEDVHREDTDDIRLMRSAHNVSIALQSGVTTVCDCGGWNKTTFSLKEAIKQGLVNGPRVLAAGRPITTTGGHCWFMGSEADGVDGVRQAARQLIKEGADFLKVMGTGGSTLGTDPFRPAFSMEELQAIGEEGHRRNRVVVAHCRTNTAMRMVVDAGFDAIMHGWFTDDTGAKVYDEKLAEHIAKNEVRVNPTLQITRSRFQLFEGRELTAEEETQYTRMQANHAETLDHCSRLFKAGVKLMAGSDCGWGVYPFGHFDRELLALVNAGLTPTQAIVAGTSNNAELLGVGDIIGTVEAGKSADLLIIEGDPSQNITDIANVTAVFKAGERIR